MHQVRKAIASSVHPAGESDLPLWRRLALNFYYHASLPYRTWRNRCRIASGRAPICVLFYHRVAHDVATPWTCSRGMFARQIDWLADNFDMLSLSEAQERIRGGANRRAAVCVTFDDGYAENCEFALPLLIRRSIPCTYFVSTQHILGGVPFAHDVARGHRFRPNTLPQIKELAASGIEIGAHTRTHANLGGITDRVRLHDEVVTAGEELQHVLGRPVRYFSFPFGQFENLNADVFQIAYEAGYEGVCSAYGGLNYPGDDAFHLQRIHVDESLLRLKNWVTVDPRKAHLPRYQYEERPAPRRTAGAVR